MRCPELVKYVVLFLTGSFAIGAAAQGYPARVVRYVVPGSAGSGADLLGRIVAAGLTQAFGQQVIVDNRAGADMVARAPGGSLHLDVRGLDEWPPLVDL
jgi:tripartite-type tricarboxylate transporter receptor subunit TctC